MSKHTLLPWSTGGIATMSDGGRTTWVWGPIEKPDHRSGAMVGGGIKLADAALIVRAVNAHQALVKALKDLVSLIPSDVGELEEVQAARAALELAKVKP